MLVLLYSILWVAVQYGAEFFRVQGFASLPFLPAAIRVLGFVLLGLWVIPYLWAAFAILSLAGLMVYPEVGLWDQLALGLFVASGGPATMALIFRLSKVSIELIDLTLMRLFSLSVACAVGNAFFYSVALANFAEASPSIELTMGIFFGDILGCITVLGCLIGINRLFRFAIEKRKETATIDWSEKIRL